MQVYIFVWENNKKKNLFNLLVTKNNMSTDETLTDSQLQLVPVYGSSLENMSDGESFRTALYIDLVEYPDLFWDILPDFLKKIGKTLKWVLHFSSLYFFFFVCVFILKNYFIMCIWLKVSYCVRRESGSASAFRGGH